MNEKQFINQGTFIEAVKKQKEEALKLANKVAESILEDTEKMRQRSAKRGGDDLVDIQIDSHSLCHHFENYINSSSYKQDVVFDDESFCFLEHPESFEVAEKLLKMHVEDRIKSGKFFCDSRIISPILQYNMENITDLDKFQFRPDFLSEEAYVELYRKEGTQSLNMGRWEREGVFGIEMSQMFIEAKSPKDFFAKLIEKNEKFPPVELEYSKKISFIIESLRGSVDDRTLDDYVAEHYSTNDRTISAEELVENIESAEQAKEIVKGVFVDVDGTLI
jgi:hypothetical protein